MSFTADQKESIFHIFDTTGFIKYENSRYVFEGNVKKTSINTFLKHLGAPECFEEESDLLPLALAFAKKTFPVKEFQALVVEWSEQNARRFGPASINPESVEGSDQVGDVNGYIRSLVPVVNITKGSSDKILLLDPNQRNRPALDIDPEYYLLLTGQTYPSLVQNDTLQVMTCFDPYTLESLFVRDTRNSFPMHHVNYYVAPKWRFTEAPAKYRGFIKDLIEHLFPNEDEKEYVLDWLHYAIVRRNETVLCLIGARGTGKGLLLNNIMEQLIGTEYHEVAKQELLTEKFNNEFRNKRHVYFDEVDVSGDRELNRFKALANNKISIESKGVDAETMDNFVSMSLSSNSKKDFRAEPQDRRFSVPEVTERPFLDIYDEDEIEAFTTRIKEPDSVEIAEFGNWLLERIPKHTAIRPLKGRYFFELCRMSMPEWKSFIIEYFITEGVKGVAVPNSVLKKQYFRIHGEDAPFVTRKASVETFLGDYLHEGKFRIGRVCTVEENQRKRDYFAIMPDDDFLDRFGKKYQEPNAEDAL
jgi:hypothetical protein